MNTHSNSLQCCTLYTHIDVERLYFLSYQNVSDFAIIIATGCFDSSRTTCFYYTLSAIGSGEKVDDDICAHVELPFVKKENTVFWSLLTVKCELDWTKKKERKKRKKTQISNDSWPFLVLFGVDKRSSYLISFSSALFCFIPSKTHWICLFKKKFKNARKRFNVIYFSYAL